MRTIACLSPRSIPRPFICANEISNALSGTKGSIVVLHTSTFATVRALPGIIRGYRKRGFEFVTVGQLLGIEGPVPFPAPEGAD